MKVLGRYELKGRLGAGGMAEVWVAQTTGPNGFAKQVVVKRILPQLSGDTVVEELFKAEAKVAARLDHPNLLQVFDFGREPDGALVLVMELVDGCSLRAVARAVKKGGQLDPRLVAKLGANVADGLHAAHALKDDAGRLLNLVHRDISPENILLSRAGAVKVADFGIARIEREVQLTRADTFRGKLGYASPEQILGNPVTPQTDLWALGVTLYELLTGARPFDADNEAALASATLERAVTRLEVLRPEVSTGLADIVHRCLERTPERRWPDAHSLAEALEAFVAETGKPVRPAELGAILTQLNIEPHAVTAAGTPSQEQELPTFAHVEPSTFQPRAELAADGTVHQLEPAPAPAPVRSEEAPAPAPQPKPTSDEALAPHHLEPLAVEVESRPALQVAPPPPASGGLARALLIAAGVVLLLASGAWALRGRLGPTIAPGTLVIDTTPSGAAVIVGSETVGETPWAGQNPAGGVTRIVLRRAGYADGVLVLDGGLDWSGSVTLKRGR
jgi:serine/threonine-protein kinase